MRFRTLLLVVCAWLVPVGCGGKAGVSAARDREAKQPAGHEYFAIEVVDADTGRGVPMVELKTTNDIRCYTDSNGLVAFREPGLMDMRAHFTVSSPGYEMKPDGFGIRGVTLDVKAGGSTRVPIKRLNIAERLYRVTGEGIYADSMLLGRPASIERPGLNGRVMGQDSVYAVPPRDRIYWFWGDTGKPDYPLGNFATTGAISEPPGKG